MKSKLCKSLSHYILCTCLLLSMIPYNNIHAESSTYELPIPQTLITSKADLLPLSVTVEENFSLDHLNAAHNSNWTIEPIDKVFCIVRNITTNKVLQLNFNENETKTVTVSEYIGNDNQLWYVELCRDNSYRIKSKLSDYCLCYQPNTCNNSNIIGVSEYKEDDSQKWYISEDVYDYANAYLKKLEEQNPELMSMKELYESERLEEERRELALDYNKNTAAIAKTDQKLKQLGLITLDEDVVEEKLKMVKPNDVYEDNRAQLMAAIPSTSNGVSWNSKRVNYVYNGKIMELQILTTQSSTSSSLYSSKVLAVTAGGFKAGARSVLKAIASDAICEAPEIGGILSTGLTAYGYLKTFMSDISSTTVIDNITCSYTLGLSGQMKVIMVKYDGSSDSSQIVGYRGNSVNVATTIVTPKYNGETVSNSTYNNVSTFSSQYYSSGAYANASKAYYNYKNNLADVTVHYVETSLPLKLVNNKTTNIKIPTISCY